MPEKHLAYLVLLQDNLNTMNRKRYTLFAALLVAVCVTVSGQKNAVYQHADNEFNEGISLYEKEKYGAAQQLFIDVIDKEINPLSQLRINSEYYDALCALELFNKDAEYKFNEFVRKHPTNSRKNLVLFQMGRLAYRNKI